MKKNAWKIFLVVAVVLLGGSFLISNQASQGADEGVTISENVKGNPDSSVVVTEYADFQCPACGQFFEPVSELMAERGNAIRFEYRHYPLLSIHAFAVPAARAAEAAGQQGKFWEMHDKLFENQSIWSTSANPTVFFIQYAEELGLDTDTFKRHMRSSLIDDKIQTEFNEAREKGYTGTPAFELNGQRMQFETLDDWRNQIDAAIDGPATSTEGAPAASTGPDVTFGI